MIKPIFIGNTLPPDDVLNAVVSLSIHVNSTAEESTTISDDRTIVKMTDLVATDNNLEFVLLCTNPVTNKVYKIKSDDACVECIYTGGVSFSAAGEEYDISPCCAIFYPVHEDSTDVAIKFSSPIKCDLEDDTLTISVTRNNDIINNNNDSDTSNAQDGIVAIQTINGITANSGNIDINGAGAMAIAVEVDKNAEEVSEG